MASRSPRSCWRGRPAAHSSPGGPRPRGIPASAFAAAPHAGQQLERHHPQAVDVAGGTQRLAAYLLRTGVLDGQGAAGFVGESRFDGLAFMHQLGDAEVEQTHLGVRGDQDVGRLEITVQHAAAVRIGDRIGHLQQQFELLPQRRSALCAPGVDRLAFDMLQRQVRAAQGIDTRIEQAGDLRVLQPGQDVALTREALLEHACPGDVRQLQRHWALDQAVAALCQPYRAHPALAQRAQQPVRADLGTRTRHRRRGATSARSWIAGSSSTDAAASRVSRSSSNARRGSGKSPRVPRATRRAAPRGSRGLRRATRQAGASGAAGSRGRAFSFSGRGRAGGSPVGRRTMMHETVHGW